jgi:hypothetical protein
LIPEGHTGTVFFITDDGYLISNYHVVKDATKVRLLTSAGLTQRRKAAKMQGKHCLFFAPWHLCVFALIFPWAQDFHSQTHSRTGRVSFSFPTNWF